MSAIDRLWPEPAADLDDDQLLEAFDQRGRPWLRVNFVSSVDGAVTDNGRSGGLSGAGDKRVFELLRRLCDVVLVGAGTVRVEGYGPMRVSEESVSWRFAHGLSPHPVFAIASGSLDLDPGSPIFTQAPVRPIVVTTERPSAAARARFESVADVVVAGKHSIDVSAMLAAFAERGLEQVHSEGGPTLFGAMLEADCVDELTLTVSPMLESGDARRIANGYLPEPFRVGLAQVLVSGGELMLRYVRA
jgi:riboflavin biosynthesis pyrimidine reductase